MDILRVQNLDRFSTWLTKAGVRISLVLFYYIECIGFFWTACYTRAKKGHENDRFMVISCLGAIMQEIFNYVGRFRQKLD